MSGVPEMDVEQVMERIRQRIRQRRSGGEAASTSAPSLPALDDGAVTADFERLHSAGDLRAIAFTSHRPLIGHVIVWTKTIVRKLLTPILDAQTAYNTAGARVMTWLRGGIEAVDRRHTQALAAANQRIERLEERLVAQATAARAELAAQATAVRAELAAQATAAREELAARVHVLGSQAQALHAEAVETARRSTADTVLRLARTERKLRRILHALETAAPETRRPDATPGPTRRPAPLADIDPEFDYAGFEDRFRGSEQDIKERQRIYVPYFEGREHVLDIGCGRGEFLELLLAHGIKARGVDVDLDMVLECRDKDLDVVREDALTYLATLADDSVGGIFAAQVIEHLEPHRIIQLVTTCYRKLAPGAALILETPNPTCLMVFADSFYRDLSHVLPIHPDTAKFLLEAAGFQDVDVKFLAPVDPSLRMPRLDIPGAAVEQFNQGIERLNSLLFGLQDYAVIGRKRWAGTHEDPIAHGPDA
jgi:SAM-dependent methyltransferase